MKVFQNMLRHSSFSSFEKDFKVTRCGFKLTVGSLSDPSFDYYSQKAWQLFQSSLNAIKIPVSFENNVVQVGKRGARFCLKIIPEIAKTSRTTFVNRIGLDVRLSGNAGSRLAGLL